MKTEITLEELLKQVTPLPYAVSDSGGDPIITCKNGDVANTIRTDKFIGGDWRTNAAYLTHCANVLPELVEASQDMLKALGAFGAEGGPIDLARIKIASALSRAEKVTPP